MGNAVGNGSVGAFDDRGLPGVAVSHSGGMQLWSCGGTRGIIR